MKFHITPNRSVPSLLKGGERKLTGTWSVELEINGTRTLLINDGASAQDAADRAHEKIGRDLDYALRYAE